MIFSNQSKLSDAQAITATAVSTNIIDLGAPGTAYGHAAALTRDQGKGKKVPLHIQVVEDFATLTSLTVTAQGSVDAAFTSPVAILATQAIPLATLKAGYVFNIDDLPLGTTYRYFRLNYTVGGSNATAGKITAGITAGNQQAPL